MQRIHTVDIIHCIRANEQPYREKFILRVLLQEVNFPAVQPCRSTIEKGQLAVMGHGTFFPSIAHAYLCCMIINV